MGCVYSTWADNILIKQPDRMYITLDTAAMERQNKLKEIKKKENNK